MNYDVIQVCPQTFSRCFVLHVLNSHVSDVEIMASFLGLEGKHVLITGASGGIGLTTAKAFLINGAKISLHYRTQQSALQELLALHPNNVCGVNADATNEKEVSACCASAVAKFGPIDSIIINHGIWPPEDIPLKDMSFDHWKHTLDVNLNGVFLFAREFLRLLEKHKQTHGNIVLISSTAAIFGEAFHADYSASKAALSGLMLSLKNEIVSVAPKGRVNTVAPGWVATPMAQSALEDKETVNRVLLTMPLHQIASTTDVANSVLFLASDKASGDITGQTITVAGGMEGRVLHPLK